MRAEAVQVAELAVILQITQLIRAQVARAHQIHGTQVLYGRSILHRERLLPGNLLGRDVRSTGIGFNLPDLIEGRHDVRESLLELFARGQALLIAEVIDGKAPGMLAGILQHFLHDEGAVVQIAGARHRKVAHRIEIGGIQFIRSPAPLVPGTEVSLVKRHAVIVKKIGRTGTCPGAKAGFSDGSIAFSQCAVDIEEPGDRTPGLAQDPVHGF